MMTSATNKSRYGRRRTSTRSVRPGGCRARHVQRHQDDGPVNRAEPVRRVLWDDHEIALGDGLSAAAVDARARQVLRIGSLFVFELAAGGERSRAFDYVEHLGLALVYGGRADGTSIFQAGVVRGQMQDVLSDDRLAVLMLRLRFFEQRGDVGGRGEGLRG